MSAQPGRPAPCPRCGGVGTHGMVHVRHGNGGGHNVPCPEARPDQHGNAEAREGFDRCPCGAKYWEDDVCVSCGAAYGPHCKECGSPLEWMGRPIGWVSAISGDLGGTYDVCAVRGTDKPHISTHRPPR